jgi:protocatechuate 3,4-dioxygenase beta subunit
VTAHGIRLRGFVAAGLALAALAAAPDSGVAQLVTGTLTDATTGEPLQGAFVTLLDPAGDERAQGLSNTAGRFFLRPRAPGRYRIRVERIGFATRTSEPVEVGPDETVERSLALSTEAIQLEGLRVGGEQRCRVRPGEGERTARIWDEARKALRVAAWAGDEEVVAYRVERFRRSLDRRGRVLDERRERASGVSRGSPVRSLPARELQEEGYIRPAEGDTWDYFAPDARVLLSDAFLDTHCLETRDGEGEREGLVGVGFEPVDRGGPPDIRGTFWLDEATAELRFLEYAYTDLPYPVEDDELGGRVEFGRVPDGPWIVRSWSIRMPRVAARPAPRGPGGAGDRVYELMGITEVGGDVAPAGEGGGAGGAAVVEGRVTEEGAPVAGARVRAVGTEVEAETDSTGAFRLEGLVGGRYALELLPPEWPWPWPVPERAEVTLAAGGDRARIHLTVPTPAELISAWCREDDPEGTALLLGRVVSARDGMVAPGAQVLVSWNRVEVRGRGYADRYRTRWDAREVRADGLGWYRVCDPPTETLLRVAALPRGEKAQELLARIWDPDLPLPRGTESVHFGSEPLLRQDVELRRR